MATTYKGLYLFPLTDSINMSCLYFESDISSATGNYEITLRQEINAIIQNMSNVQGSVLNARKNSVSYACTEHFHNTSMYVYFVPYFDGTYYVNINDTYSGGTQFLVATGGAYIAGVQFLILAKTQDNHFCLGRAAYILNSQDVSDRLGLSIPSGASPGYASLDLPPSPIVSIYRYNASTATRYVSDYFTGNPPVPSPIQPTDPYAAGGNSEPGGGEGDFDGTSDSIDIPPLPTVSAVDAGFITLFNPTLAELKSLSSYMWSGLFDVATFRKLFADPMDAILGLSLVPVAVPNGSSTEVTVGNIPTGIFMTLAASQYVEIDCGTLNVNEYWGAYLDYEPYTRAELYLPYIGMHAISVDDIMGKAVSIKYHVDVLSGACVAYVKCGDSVLYSYVGQCSMQIPLTSTNWASAISATLNLAGSIGMTIASGGLSAPVTAASVVGVASSAASAANQIKPSIQRSGAMAGTGGYMANQKPYIILTRPRQCLPADQNKILGYPSFVTMDLSELEGYTQIAEIHLSGIPATSSELAEIESLLKEGVIF